ncbi:hypothetical protein B566_EDAN018422 [Ephemera danica]|nr:hypothetical protein B566_EDAN018422 [Ephemera danica]
MSFCESCSSNDTTFAIYSEKVLVLSSRLVDLPQLNQEGLDEDARKARSIQIALQVSNHKEREFEEAEYESLAVLQSSYEKEAKNGAETSETTKQLADLIRHKVAQLKNTELMMARLGYQYKEAEGRGQAKSQSESKCVGALKALIKIFDDSLSTKIERNEETGLIEVTFLEPNGKGEKVKFPISLKDVGPGKYDKNTCALHGNKGKS